MLPLTKPLRILIFLCFCSCLIALTSCSSKDNYPYQKGLNAFMLESFNVNIREIKNDKVFFFVDASCDECIQSKIDGVSNYITDLAT